MLRIRSTQSTSPLLATFWAVTDHQHPHPQRAAGGLASTIMTGSNRVGVISEAHQNFLKGQSHQGTHLIGIQGCCSQAKGTFLCQPTNLIATPSAPFILMPILTHTTHSSANLVITTRTRE
jgi:hypothetical protein